MDIFYENQPLISDIQKYEPNFDYDIWIDKLDKKKKLVDKTNKEIEQLIKSDILSQELLDNLDTIYVTDENTDNNELSTYTLCTSSESFDYSDDLSFILDLLQRYYLIKQPDNIVVHPDEIDITQIGYENIMEYISILSTPDTLNEYLLSIVNKHDERSTLSNSKFYDLYIMINKYTWHFNSYYAGEKKELIIEGNNIELEDIKFCVSEILPDAVILSGNNQINVRLSEHQMDELYDEIHFIDRIMNPALRLAPLSICIAM